MAMRLQFKSRAGKRVACGLLAAAIVLQAAGPAVAFTIGYKCFWWNQGGRFVELSEEHILDDDELSRTISGVLPENEANDFVSFLFEVEPYAETLSESIGLQHCPTGKGLLIFNTHETQDAVLEAFEKLMQDDAVWSMSEIAGEMRKLGAKTEMRSGGMGNCACENAKDDWSFIDDTFIDDTLTSE